MLSFKEQAKISLIRLRMANLLWLLQQSYKKKIVPAPQEVKDFFGTMLPYAEIVDITEKALTLRQAYLDAKIVSAKYSNDALHVALATVSDCPIIVSWNFKHIVHYQKIPLYNAVNILQGYNQIAIYSPLEVMKYED